MIEILYDSKHYLIDDRNGKKIKDSLAEVIAQLLSYEPPISIKFISSHPAASEKYVLSKFVELYNENFSLKSTIENNKARIAAQAGIVSKLISDVENLEKKS